MMHASTVHISLYVVYNFLTANGTCSYSLRFENEFMVSDVTVCCCIFLNRCNKIIVIDCNIK